MAKPRRRAIVMLVITMIMACASLVVAPAASADTVVSSRVVNGVTIKLWYNQGWNWVSVQPQTFTNAGGEVGIWSAASGSRWTPSYMRFPSWTTTGAVWAPGSTCVTITANVVSNYSPYTRVWQSWQVC